MNWLSTGLSTGALLAVLAVWLSARAYANAAAVLIRDQGHRIDTLNLRCGNIERSIDGLSSTKLAAQLGDVLSAIESDRAAMRRELGKLWARMPGNGAEPKTASSSELDAFLELQRGFGGTE